MYMTIKLRHILAGLLIVASQSLSAQTLSDGQTVVKNALLTPQSGQMLLTMDVCLDELKLKHNQSVVMHPVLYSLDGTLKAAFDPMVIDSHAEYVLYERGLSNVAYSNVPHVSRRSGKPQTEYYRSTVPYESWMDGYELRLEEDLCACGDLSQLPYVTSLRRDLPPDPYTLIALANLEPVQDKAPYELHGSAFINFVVDRWEMKPDYMDNRRELRKITDTLDIMVADKNITVKEIKIHGWASPESPFTHNRMLATNRAKSLTEWLRKNYDLPTSAFAPAEATPENWIGLREAVEKMDGTQLAHRDEIHSIIRELLLKEDREIERTADATEARIKSSYPQDYQYLLRTVYPSLRRSDYEITFNVRTFNTIDECLQIYRTKPYQLSQHELWRVAQTFEPYSDEYNRALQTALNNYPDDEAVNLNLANVAIQQRDPLKAETLLQRAGNSGAAENARAVVCILRGQYEEAARHLDNAQQKGIDVSRNRQAIQKMLPYKDRK